MKTRVISALIMLPLLLIVYLGGSLLIIATFLIGLIGIREFYGAFETVKIQGSYTVANICILLLYGINLFFDSEPRLYMLWMAVLVALSFLYMFNITHRKVNDGLVTLMGIGYVIFLSFHVVLVDQTGPYNILIWLIFITAFGTDIFAYFTGMLIGKHKLCPNISPKKTVEGAVGGVVGSIILSGLFGFIFCREYLIYCLILGVVGGIMSQLGDLSASVIKRKLKIKDYGKLIPGHGGILDRFDSVLFTAPTVYYTILIISIFNNI